MSTANQLRVHIRWMVRKDLPEVVSIEKESFEYPWSEDDFVRHLRGRHHIGMVADYKDTVVGFMAYDFYESTIHLDNFAVRPDFRREGVGKALMDKLQGKLTCARRRRILLEVKESNVSAQLFFKEMGFRAVRVLRNFYDDTNEDAYLMNYVHQSTT